MARPGHPVFQDGETSFSQLKNFQFALPNRRFGIRRLIDQTMHATQSELTIAFESDSLQLIKQLVSQTDMLTCLPRIVFEREVSNQTLAAIPLKDAICSAASIDIITQQSRTPSGAARKFLAMLLDTAKSTYS